MRASAPAPAASRGCRRASGRPAGHGVRGVGHDVLGVRRTMQLCPRTGAVKLKAMDAGSSSGPVLGIETVCDETAAAVLAPDGRVWPRRC